MVESSETKSLLAAVYYPRLGSPGLDELRREHDPFASVIAEHLTLLFPVPVPEEEVVDHVRTVAAGTAPFDVHVAGVAKTWDHWLYLEVKEGRGAIVRLHERLYTGPVAAYRRDDLPFEPHVGIGFFGVGPYDPLDPEPVELHAEAYERARARAEGLGVDAWRRVDVLTVVRLDPAAGTVEDVAEIALGDAPSKTRARPEPGGNEVDREER